MDSFLNSIFFISIENLKEQKQVKVSVQQRKTYKIKIYREGQLVGWLVGWLVGFNTLAVQTFMMDTKLLKFTWPGLQYISYKDTKEMKLDFTISQHALRSKVQNYKTGYAKKIPQ